MMIKTLMQDTKEAFLKRFTNPKHQTLINSIKSDSISLVFIPDDELKTLKQNKAVHALILELYKSGLSSFDDFNSCRDFFKEKAGLIYYDKQFLDPVMLNIQKKVYQMLPTPELKLAHKQTILNGQRVVRSVADATKEEVSLMIDEVLVYCNLVGLNTPKYQEILKGMNLLDKDSKK